MNCKQDTSNYTLSTLKIIHFSGLKIEIPVPIQH